MIEQRIADNLRTVRSAIVAACEKVGRDPSSIRLIAVTKSQGTDVIAPLLQNGVSELGENRIDHLVTMREAAPDQVNFHYIGRVQGRQLSKLVPYCTHLHSLCELDHIKRLGHACETQRRKISVFLQVNTAGDEAKAGISPEQLPAFIEAVNNEKHVDLVGLMTMAPLGSDGNQASESRIRSTFSKLRELAQENHLPRLSMGMSEDFSLAIEEGATDIRVGTRLFV